MYIQNRMYEARRAVQLGANGKIAPTFASTESASKRLGSPFPIPSRSSSRTANRTTKSGGKQLAKSAERLSYWWRTPMKTTKAKRQSESSRLAARQRGRVKSTTANSIRVVTDDELARDPKVNARIKRELAALA